MTANAFDAWFESLPEGRKAVLREDKWLLAEAAFEAGRQMAMEQVEQYISYSYVAKRDDDGSAWSGGYFTKNAGLYAHSDAISGAMKAKSVDELKNAVASKLVTGSYHSEQANGLYTIMKIARNRVVEVMEEGFAPLTWEGPEDTDENAPMVLGR
jgi:hypothetical protein